MIYPGKGNINIFKMVTGFDHFTLQRHVGNHQDIGVLCLFNQDLRIVISLIGFKAVACFCQGLYQIFQRFAVNGQGF